MAKKVKAFIKGSWLNLNNKRYTMSLNQNSQYYRNLIPPKLSFQESINGCNNLIFFRIWKTSKNLKTKNSLDSSFCKALRKKYICQKGIKQKQKGSIIQACQYSIVINLYIQLNRNKNSTAFSELQKQILIFLSK